MTPNSTFRSVMIAVLSLSLLLGFGFFAVKYMPDLLQVPAHPETLSLEAMLIEPEIFVNLLDPEPVKPMFKAPLTQDGMPIFDRIYQNNSVLMEDLYFQIRGFGLKADQGKFYIADKSFAAQWYHIALDWHEAYCGEICSVFMDSRPPVAILPEGYYRKFIDLDVAFDDAVRELKECMDYPDAKLAIENGQEPWNVLIGYWDLLQDIHDEMVKLSSYYPRGFRLIDVAEAESLSTFLEFRYANMIEDMEEFKYMDRTQGEAMDELQMAYQDDIAELKRMGDRKTFLLRRENTRREIIRDRVNLILETHDVLVPLILDGSCEEAVLWSYVDILIADIAKRNELCYTDEEFNRLDAHLTSIVERLMDMETEREFRNNQDDSMTDENLEMRK